MKNIFLLILCFMFIACAKKEKKEEVPVQDIQIQEAVIPVEDEIIIASNLVFRVQIAALKNKNKTLANLDGIHVFQENSLTKYRLGSLATYQEAKRYRSQLISTYKGAFVQALRNDVPIHIKEALEE